MWGTLGRIPLWENRRRQRVLGAFRRNVEQYFEETDYDSTFDNYIDTEESAATRRAINESVSGVDRIVQYAGISAIIDWSPPSMTGGYARQIPVIAKVFHLHQFQMSQQSVIDFVARAIGEYRLGESAARIRTFNPFFWLGLALDYFATLPFRFLRRAGFNTTKVEQSWPGRLLKLILEVIGLVGSLVTILQAIGKLSPLLKILGFP